MTEHQIACAGAVEAAGPVENATPAHHPSVSHRPLDGACGPDHSYHSLDYDGDTDLRR